MHRNRVHTFNLDLRNESFRMNVYVRINVGWKQRVNISEESLGITRTGQKSSSLLPRRRIQLQITFHAEIISFFHAFPNANYCIVHRFLNANRTIFTRVSKWKRYNFFRTFSNVNNRIFLYVFKCKLSYVFISF